MSPRFVGLPSLAFYWRWLICDQLLRLKHHAGTPFYKGSIQKILENACRDAEKYVTSNIDGVLMENMNDVPYVQAKHLGPETTAVMSLVCGEVRRLVPSSIPCGVQVLAGGNKEAVAIAHASGLQFIRAEGYVFSHVADEGFTDSSAGELLPVKKGCSVPVLIGSGVTAANLCDYLQANAVIVGTHFKHNGQ
uniref:Uncharacterized protein n=1 Tax=Timema genevievae TaxID=629358 RepID=A0A7R9PQ07_TIMGE|nr:unnamed protein product [Timema genevievae]